MTESKKRHPQPAPEKTIGRCPICEAPIKKVAEEFPFCSMRCRLVDLGKWLGESYRVPSRPQDLD